MPRLLPTLVPLGLAGAAACVAPGAAPHDPASARPPNVLLVLTDDQGYGDLGVAGHPTLRTPVLDRLAAEGTRLTQFYVGSPVCSPSRAALLTGCYPRRIGMERHVVFPESDWGLAPEEVTLAEALGARDYATGCFGKWHLGHRRGLLPTDQGFDEFWGVPYSNDMSQAGRPVTTGYAFRLPVLAGDEVVEWEPDQRELTRRTTAAAVDFIERHAGEPFLCYVPYSMPHVPLFASEAFAGRSPRGLYGDVIEELDHGVGELLAALERAGIADDTLVLFLSDNGPWLEQGLAGGSAGPLRGGKGTTWEGGVRVPFLARWPGRVPAGAVRTEVVTAMDLLPTLAGLAGAAVPAGAADGRDVGAVLLGGSPTPREAPLLVYESRGALGAIRRGPWKLRLASGELFHLEHDVGEGRDVAAEHPELVAELRALAATLAAEVDASARPRATSEVPAFDPLRPGS